MGEDLELHLNFLAQTDELPFTFNENKSWDASKRKADCTNIRDTPKNITISSNPFMIYGNLTVCNI